MPSILFLSSAEISLPLFRALHEDSRFEITGLVCQPDRAAGRGMEMKAPASKVMAEEFGIPVYQPENLRKESGLLDELQGNPPDFLLTFAYGQILSQSWLDLATISPVNVHTSLLPKYRGASPIQSALLNADVESGISVMRMVKEMDAGPVYSQHRILTEDMNAGELHDALAELAAKDVPEALIAIAEGLQAQEQEGEVTYCHKISPADAQFDFEWTAEEALCAYRAYSPWPKLWSKWNGKRLKFLNLSESEQTLTAGQLSWDGERLLMGVKGSALEIHELQLEGKIAMPAADFIRGQSGFVNSQIPS